MLLVSDKWQHRLDKIYLFLNVFYKEVNYTCAVGTKVRLIFFPLDPPGFFSTSADQRGGQVVQKTL